MLLIGIALALAQTPVAGQPPPAATPPATVPPAATPPATTVPPALSTGVPATPAKPQYPSQVGGKSLPEWVKELSESKDAAIRELAVKALPAFGPAAREPSLKPLLKACRDDADPGVRVNAILTLGQIGANNKDEAKSIIDALVNAINNASVGGVVRLHATRAVANYGEFTEQANDAIPTLANISKDPSWETRKSVAYALGRVGGPTKEKVATKVGPSALRPPPPVDPKTGPNPAATKALLAMLTDTSATVRIEVVEALVVLGPPAVNPDQYSVAVTPYMNAIGERVKAEKEKSVLVWIHMLAMRLDGNQFNDSTIGKLIDLGRGPDPFTTCQALAALSLLGDKANGMGLPFAAEMLRHSEPLCVGAAATYLANVGVAAKPYVPQLEAAKKETTDNYLKIAIDAAIEAANGKKTPVVVAPKK